MKFIGVDPGFYGALAVLTETGFLTHVINIPLLKVGNKHEYDRQEIKSLLSNIVQGQQEESFRACVELVHTFPEQGIVSAFRFGQGFELWCMAFTMLEIPLEMVTPQRWKDVMLSGLPKDKDASRYRAKQLWPEQAEQFSRKKDDGRAEAALIAEYLRRQWMKI